MLKFRHLWSNLRSSFWFLPSLIVLVNIIFAIVFIEADSAGSDRWLARWPRLFGVGAEGSRQMLATLAGSMMTVLGVTFSMTLVALTLASSQYTSRILRNFIRSKVTQGTLGAFAGTFVYCLIVLRTIRGSGGAEFVPGLAVFFAFMLALGSVGVLIFFIHHLAGRSDSRRERITLQPSRGERTVPFLQPPGSRSGLRVGTPTTATAGRDLASEPGQHPLADTKPARGDG